MLLLRKVRTIIHGGTGFCYPYVFDATSLPDGSLPSTWTGSTWTIASGKITNSPTLGSELLTDPGMEATYSSGQCNTFTKSGSPTLVQSADVHGGSKAQQMTAAAFNNRVSFPVVANTINQWYDARVWAKLTAGSGGNPKLWVYHSASTTSALLSFNSTSYTEYGVLFRAPSAGNINFYPVVEKGSSGFDTITVDDASLKAITLSTLFAWLPPAQPDIVIKIRPVRTSYGTAGAIARANSPTNPTSFILMQYRWGSSANTARIALEQCVSGTYTSLIDQDISYTSGVDLELRISGDSAQFWYNHSQVSTTQSIDATLANNSFVGMFGSGGGQMSRFFCTKQMTEWPVVHEGTSITNASDSFAWRIQTDNHMILEHQQYNITATNISMGSANSWYGLNKQSTLFAANPMYVTLDGTNDINTNGYRAMEAYIRKIWTTNPNTRLTGWMFPKFPDNSDASINSVINADYMTKIIDLYNHYSIPYLDYLTPLRNLINNEGHHLSEYYAADDAVHPLEAGHNLAYSVIAPYLPDGGTTAPSTLPSRLYDNGDYEYDPTQKLGTAYDSVSGSWTTSGSRVSSSEVGAIITYSATCTSWGLWRDDAEYNIVYVSVDGGEWVDTVAFGKTGTEIATGRGAHTMSFKVKSGTVVVDQFWAI